MRVNFQIESPLTFPKLGTMVLTGMAQWVLCRTLQTQRLLVDSQSGHRPGFWARPLIRDLQEATY